MKEQFLLKLGEIVLKGQNRKQFENKLKQNVNRRMRPFGDFYVSIVQSTVFVEPKNDECDLDGAWEACHSIFGVVSLCRCRACAKDLDAIYDAVLEYLTSVPSLAIGIGLTTVAGQCIGAGRLDEAKHNIKKLTLWSCIALFLTNWLIFFLLRPISAISGLEADAAALTYDVMLVISIVKPFLWALAFVPTNGMRAAGDVRFGMITTTVTMWVFRFGISVVACRVFNGGLICIWCGYFVDWLVRSIVFTLRFRSGKWAEKRVIGEA